MVAMVANQGLEKDEASGIVVRKFLQLHFYVLYTEYAPYILNANKKIKVTKKTHTYQGVAATSVAKSLTWGFQSFGLSDVESNTTGCWLIFGFPRVKFCQVADPAQETSGSGPGQGEGDVPNILKNTSAKLGVVSGTATYNAVPEIIPNGGRGKAVLPDLVQKRIGQLPPGPLKDSVLLGFSHLCLIQVLESRRRTLNASMVRITGWVVGLVLIIFTLWLLGHRTKQMVVFQNGHGSINLQGTPRELPLGIKHTFLPVYGDCQISVYFREEHLKQPGPVVLFTHGTLTCCEAKLFIFQVPETPMALVMWDYRGYGRSTGAATEKNIVHDLHTVVTWICRTYDKRPGEVVQWGHSLGTYIIGSYLAYSPAKIERVILQDPFTRMTDMGNRLCNILGFLAGNMDVVQNWKEYTGEVLMIAADNDPLLPLDKHVGELLQSMEEGNAPSKVQLYVVRSDFHIFNFDPDILKEVRRFALEGPTAPSRGSALVHACTSVPEVAGWDAHSVGAE